MLHLYVVATEKSNVSDHSKRPSATSLHITQLRSLGATQCRPGSANLAPPKHPGSMGNPRVSSSTNGGYALAADRPAASPGPGQGGYAGLRQQHTGAQISLPFSPRQNVFLVFSGFLGRLGERKRAAFACKSRVVDQPQVSNHEQRCLCSSGGCAGGGGAMRLRRHDMAYVAIQPSVGDPRRRGTEGPWPLWAGKGKWGS
ncbi:hypothetical protein O1611_g3998 [Lasiodiplodia mahajangana]|uniref:Uncharacterized protein n=1 Tax=Lasiodiplodia mahajangana TaxID=1108764 RepID=A0ACC2JQM5_9PEZI|nr:hypothetical protein O1611_g3998 [Lasiodiplodia mahajangana]